MPRRGGRGRGRSSGGFRLGPAFTVNLGTSHPNRGMEYIYIFLFGMAFLCILGYFAQRSSEKKLEVATPQLTVVDNTWATYDICKVSQVEAGSTGNGNVSIERTSLTGQEDGNLYQFIVRANGYKQFRLNLLYQDNQAPNIDKVVITAKTDSEEAGVLYEKFLEDPDWNYKHLTFQTTSGESLDFYLFGGKLTYAVVQDPSKSCFK